MEWEREKYLFKYKWCVGYPWWLFQMAQQFGQQKWKSYPIWVRRPETQWVHCQGHHRCTNHQYRGGGRPAVQTGVHIKLWGNIISTFLLIIKSSSTYFQHHTKFHIPDRTVILAEEILETIKAEVKRDLWTPVLEIRKKIISEWLESTNHSEETVQQIKAHLDKKGNHRQGLYIIRKKALESKFGFNHKEWNKCA